MSLAEEKRKLIVAAKFAYRMASSSADLTCAHCNEPLPSNDLLPGWPFGTILAVDEVDRLLWAICERCEGWTLSPEGTALDLLDALGTWRERADASWLSPEVTELTTNGVRVLIRHEPRAHHAVPYADSPARRRRRVALVLWAVFIATYIGVQLLDVEPVWPYFAAFGLVVLVSLLQPHPKKGVQFESRDGRKFRLLPDAGAELRPLPDGGWQIEIGDATPSGAVRAFGRTRFLGSDALNAVQRLIAVSLAGGARYPDIRVAQEILPKPAAAPELQYPHVLQRLPRIHQRLHGFFRVIRGPIDFIASSSASSVDWIQRCVLRSILPPTSLRCLPTLKLLATSPSRRPNPRISSMCTGWKNASPPNADVLRTNTWYAR